MTSNTPACLVDGKPHYSKTPPASTHFVGMEKEPTRPPRYGKLFHPWFNKPCYETKPGVDGP